MNVHALALAKAHRFDEQTSAFAGDVIDDLSQHPKRLSPKYFYDSAGSELFDSSVLVSVIWTFSILVPACIMSCPSRT